MKANLKIEAINYGNDQMIKSWGDFLDITHYGLGEIIRMPSRYGVWTISDGKQYEVYGKTDYSSANSKATRGVYINYILESGKVYYVSNPTSWKCVERFFATVDSSGNIIKHESYRDAKKAIG